MKAMPVPEPLASFLPRLEARGVHCARSDYDEENFGNRIIELKGPSLSVTLILDRGVWLMTVSDLQTPEDAYELKLLNQLLIGRLPDRFDLSEAMSFLDSSMDEIVEALSPARRAETTERLAALQDRACVRSIGHPLRTATAERVEALAARLEASPCGDTEEDDEGVIAVLLEWMGLYRSERARLAQLFSGPRAIALREFGARAAARATRERSSDLLVLGLIALCLAETPTADSLQAQKLRALLDVAPEIGAVREDVIRHAADALPAALAESLRAVT